MFSGIKRWWQERRENQLWDEYHRLSLWAQEQRGHREGLTNYWDLPILKASHFSGVRIVVDSEVAKQQILLALRYIHDLREIDLDYVAVNYLAHLYETPEAIEVDVPHPLRLHEGYACVRMPTADVTPEVSDWVSDLEPLTWHWYFNDPQDVCRFYFRKHEDAAGFRAAFPTSYAG